MTFGAFFFPLVGLDASRLETGLISRGSSAALGRARYHGVL